ncbi:hypothetical protein BAU25_12380 [Bacillus albus]|uniref:Uncharacterized protein n=1 Tax=Bacillus albus TaxID=2026189 RepID=A0A1J9UHH1_9BACI|nr:hypothetical protein BAU25_12380 [Bacillus albus]
MKKECRILKINRMGRKKLKRFILYYANIDVVFKAIHFFRNSFQIYFILISTFVVACIFQK